MINNNKGKKILKAGKEKCRLLKNVIRQQTQKQQWKPDDHELIDL